VNKDLYNKKVKIPDEIREHMKNSLNSVSAESNDVGFKRNNELQNAKEMTYQQLKRIKNFFDTYKGDVQEKSYILNGGDYMKNWVNETLRFMRDDIYTIKKNKQEAGFQNQFNKEHQKNDISSMNRSSKSHKKTVDNYNTEITETLKRINEIMKKII
jgi:hypothetical protein